MVVCVCDGGRNRGGISEKIVGGRGWVWKGGKLSLSGRRGGGGGKRGGGGRGGGGEGGRGGGREGGGVEGWMEEGLFCPEVSECDDLQVWVVSSCVSIRSLLPVLETGGNTIMSQFDFKPHGSIL